MTDQRPARGAPAGPRRDEGEPLLRVTRVETISQSGVPPQIDPGAGDVAFEPAPLNLGERVRQLRQARSWTLEAAARRAGLARSTLSKIENGQMSPTFDAVQKLAFGLGIDVPQLFTAPVTDRVTGRRAVTRLGEGRLHATTTYEHELLGAEISRKRLLPYRTTVRARAFSDFAGWIRHDGEEFLLVLAGAVCLYTEFYEPVDLGPGDSAYYDAAMGHCVVSTSPEDATILWVTSL